MARTFDSADVSLNKFPTVQHRALERVGARRLDIDLTAAVSSGSVTLAPVTEFTFKVQTGRKYQVQARLNLTSDGTGGTKIDFAGGSATATLVNGRFNLETSAASGVNVSITALNTSIGAAAAHILGDGWLTFTATSDGTIAMQFAQTAANLTSTLNIGSQLTVIDVTPILGD